MGLGDLSWAAALGTGAQVGGSCMGLLGWSDVHSCEGPSYQVATRLAPEIGTWDRKPLAPIIHFFGKSLGKKNPLTDFESYAREGQSKARWLPCAAAHWPSM